MFPLSEHELTVAYTDNNIVVRVLSKLLQPGVQFLKCSILKEILNYHFITGYRL